MERVQKVMRKHRIQAPVKPHLKLRNLLVHPNDKIETGNKCNVIYESYHANHVTRHI